MAAIEFEETLRGALRVPAPANLADRILLAQTTQSRQQRRGWNRGVGAFALAAAASIVIAVVALRHPQAEMPALAGMVFEHLDEHVVNVEDAQSPLPKQDIMAAFADRGVDLASVPDGINYVHKCPAGPYKAMHMVMPESSGPVSVVYVVDKPSQRSVDFTHDGMRGREVPIGKGSLVLIASSDDGFDAIESSWKRALVQDVAFLDSAESKPVGPNPLWSPLIRKSSLAAP